ncbi:MAG: type II toxin-antitoxin system VapB family antitoxin [Acidimicrobiia bacterium]
MAPNSKNEEADRLARELADLTGESLTEAVVVALRERLDRERARRDLVRRVTRLADEVSSYPVLDARTAEEIVDYDEAGLAR